MKLRGVKKSKSREQDMENLRAASSDIPNDVVLQELLAKQL